jgi:hypothetical protein
VEHKPLFHNVLAIFRVAISPTLKMANLLYDNYLRTTQKKDHTKAKAQTAKLKDRAGIVSACMLARSRMFEI